MRFYDYVAVFGHDGRSERLVVTGTSPEDARARLAAAAAGELREKLLSGGDVHAIGRVVLPAIEKQELRYGN